MIIPNLKASETSVSYLYRLARVNGILDSKFFHRYILLKNGLFVGNRKTDEKLRELLGRSNHLLIEEILKRTRDILNFHRVSNYSVESWKEHLHDDKYYRKQDRVLRICPMCIKEQHFHYGHAWLKLDWLSNHTCVIHNEKLQGIDDISIKLKLNFFDTFEHCVNGKLTKNDNLKLNNNFLIEDRINLIAPCVIVNYFGGTRAHGCFDFKKEDEPFDSLVSNYYQYLNCFPLDELNKFKQYLRFNVKSCLIEGFHFYKSSTSCTECPHINNCLFVHSENLGVTSVDELDISSILKFVFQSSGIPEHISHRQVDKYSSLLNTICDFYDESTTFESDTIHWLITLMKATFSTHSEFFDANGDYPKFDNISRDPISGLLFLKLKRSLSISSVRKILLPRGFEKQFKAYIEKYNNGKTEQETPLILNKSGSKAMKLKGVNIILKDLFDSFEGVPPCGTNLHSIRDVIAVSALSSGANLQYLTKYSGLANSQLLKENILPLKNTPYASNAL